MEWFGTELTRPFENEYKGEENRKAGTLLYKLFFLYKTLLRCYA